MIKRVLSERRDYFQPDCRVGGINQSAAFRRDPLAAAIFISLRLREVLKVTISLVQMRILAGGACGCERETLIQPRVHANINLDQISQRGDVCAETERERESSLCEQHLYDQNGSL